MGSLYRVSSLVNISILVNTNLHLCFLPLFVSVCVCVNGLSACDVYAHMLRKCMCLRQALGIHWTTLDFFYNLSQPCSLRQSFSLSQASSHQAPEILLSIPHSVVATGMGGHFQLFTWMLDT